MISWLRNRRRFVSFINIWHRNIHIYLLLSRDELSRWFAQRESLMDILWNTYTIIMKRMDHIRLCQKSRSVWTVFAIWSRTVLWFPCHGVIWNKNRIARRKRSGIYIGLPMYCHNFWKNVDLRQSQQVGLKEVILYYWMMLCAHITGIILMGKVQIHIVRFI